MRGRKPDQDNVVPLTGDQSRGNFDGYAASVANGLRPPGLEDDVRQVYDRIAPLLCHPTVVRLKPHMVDTFVLMCRMWCRFETIRKLLADPEVGETYESETRNGVQLKSRPEVAQMNEAFRNFLTLARDFGLTPAAERGIKNAAQGQLPFEEGDFT